MVYTKVVVPSNAEEFKAAAKRYLPETWVDQIAKLAYKGTTEYRYNEEEHTDVNEKKKNSDENQNKQNAGEKDNKHDSKEKENKQNTEEKENKQNENKGNENKQTTEENENKPNIEENENKQNKNEENENKQNTEENENKRTENEENTRGELAYAETHDNQTALSGFKKVVQVAEQGLTKTFENDRSHQRYSNEESLYLRENEGVQVRHDNNTEYQRTKSVRSMPNNEGIARRPRKLQKVPKDQVNDYLEPESVPAPKPKGKHRRPKPDKIYETIKIKSNKKKDSYEDYVMPPKEANVYASDDEGKGKQKKRKPPQEEGSFIGETLGDETDEAPPKIKEVHNKRIPIAKPATNRHKNKPKYTHKKRPTNYDDAQRKPGYYDEYPEINNKENNQGNYEDYDGPTKPKRGAKKHPEDYDSPTKPKRGAMKRPEDYDGPTKPKRGAKKRPEFAEYKERERVTQQKKVSYAYDYDKIMNAQGTEEYDNVKLVKATRAQQKAPENYDYDQQPIKNKPQYNDYRDENEKSLYTKRQIKETEYTEPTDVYDVDENPRPTTPRDLKAKTENIGDEEDEEILNTENENGAHYQPTTHKKRKSTHVLTREVFQLSTPDYYNKQPKVVEKFNFEEPLPEEDREEEVTKSWLGPPAKINGRVDAAG